MPTSKQDILLDLPVQVFWTGYDPLDLASGSLDPLGFARGYLALADRLLPGFTTVTTIPRYVSMLCAALREVHTHYRKGSTVATSKGRQERLRMVKSFERAWAIACGLASEEPTIGQRATSGLRGIRYVSRRLETLSNREMYFQTSSFNLLSNQVRYGGIGIYSTFLEECHLASIQSFTLRPLGEKLAEAFPSPGTGVPLHDEESRLSLATLREWGAKAHIGAFSNQEGKVLTKALGGGDEADNPDHVRWAVIRMLAKLKPQPGDDEGVTLRALGEDLHGRKFDGFGAPVTCLAQIAATLRILEPFEKFYQAVVFLFERIRGAVSDEVEVSLAALSQLKPILEAYRAIRKFAAELRSSMQKASEESLATAGEVATVLRDSGIIALTDDALRDPNGSNEMMRLVLRRHGQVQSGKFDRGMPKAAWIRLTDHGDRVRLSAQRYQLPKSQRPKVWRDVGRHPYRTESAMAFIRACKID